MELDVLDSIESSVLRPERDIPYVFVGRLQELARLDNHFSVIRDRNQGSSGLFLVYGIPGIGKTQLIEKFARDKENSGEALWLRLHTEDLTDSRVLTMLQSALKLRRSKFRWTDVEISVLGLKTNIALDQQYEDLATGLDQLVHSKYKQPIIVTVDEIQQLEPSQAAILRKLHTGRPGLPVMIVGAGLQNTLDVLQQNGLSRLGETIELDLLDLEACEEATLQMLEVWGRVVSDRGKKSVEPKVKELARSSQAFPCHLQSHLSALKAVVRDKRERFGTNEDWVQVSEIAKQKRNEYYAGRIEALGFPNAGIVMHRIAKLLRERKIAESKCVSSADVIKILNSVEQDGMVDIDKGAALRRMIKSGNLKVEDYSFYTIPIPSFQEHLLAITDPFSEFG